jgi:hypothetical protein
MINSIRINNNLYVDSQFNDFMCSINNIIRDMFYQLPTDPSINYIMITDKPDVVSYLPKSKDNNVEDPYSCSGRIYIKVGRLINKLFSKELLEKYITKDSIIESFVNSYKSFFDPSKNKLMVVSGSDIKWYYLDKNYLTINGNTSGTLWNSCMRYTDRQRYLEMYECNNIKMLVLTVDCDGVTKVRARSLLWEAIDELGNTVKIMDRIYSNVDTFKKWARENGYIPKLKQNSKSHRIFDVNGDVVKMELSVKLDKHILSYYPYLDTFPYFDMINGVIYNTERRCCGYKLVQANGSLIPPDRDRDSEDRGDFVEEYDEDYDPGF